MLSPLGHNLMVTPKEVDTFIEDMANVIASGLNAALHHQIDQDNKIEGTDDYRLSRFTLLCICSVALCLLMMIAGVALANHGLKSMKGYQQLSYEQIAHMTGTESTGAESEILGSSFSASEKQQQLERLRSFNVVEGIGMAVASVAYEMTKFGTDIVVGKIKGILAKSNMGGGCFTGL